MEKMVPQVHLINEPQESDYDTESLNSVDFNSYGEIKKALYLRYPKYDPAKISLTYQWKKGLEFTSIEQFKCYEGVVPS